MTVKITRICCPYCGNEDPDIFTRYYVEESMEKIVDGVWTTRISYEFDEGAHTFTECDLCGACPEETYEEATE